MILLPRLLPFLCLLMLLPRFSHGLSVELVPVLPLFLFMGNFALTYGADSLKNQCLESGEYLKIGASGINITNKPEDGVLTDVGNKVCGFKTVGMIKDPFGGCLTDFTIEFAAFELKSQAEPHCEFWSDVSICFCGSFGCNSATGSLYETLLRSFANSIHENQKVRQLIVGVDYTKNFVSHYGTSVDYTDCLLDMLQKLYSSHSFRRRNAVSFQTSLDEELGYLKADHPELFPNQTVLDNLGKKNLEVNPPVPVSGAPASAGGAAAGDSKDNEDKGGLNLAVLIGAFVGGIVLIIVAGLLIFFIIRKKKSGSDKAMKKGARLGVAALAEQENILQAMKNSHKAVKEKLKEAKLEIHQGDREALRYHDVPCIEATRVKCKGGEFVHANHFTACDGKKFIAFQGPLPSTIEQTWIMLKEQECKVIVMLCLFKEKKTKTSTEFNDKCGPYFPENEEEKATFGSVTVTCLSTVRVPLIGVVQRKLQIDVAGQPPFLVEHLQYMNWVDHGCPPEPHQISELKDLVDGMETIGPLGVHCSAGVGRTGTFIGLYEGMAMLKEEHKFDTEMVMTRLREARASMVQHDTQFVMLTVVLVEIMAEKGIIPRDKNYDKIMAAWEEQKRESELQPSH